MSCAGTHIHVWSINGNPVVSVNTFTGRSQQIVCCCVSEMNEWDTQNVIVTGHSDGVVRVSRPGCPPPGPAAAEGCPEVVVLLGRRSPGATQTLATVLPDVENTRYSTPFLPVK